MNKMRKLQLRTISFILTLTILAGCVYSSAAANAVSSDHVDHRKGNLVERVYDSGNVTLSNQVKAEKDNIFAIKLNVKIKEIDKLLPQTDSASSDTGNSTVSSAVEGTVDLAPVSSAAESTAVSSSVTSEVESKVDLDPDSTVVEETVNSAPAAPRTTDSTGLEPDSTAVEGTAKSAPAASEITDLNGLETDSSTAESSYDTDSSSPAVEAEASDAPTAADLTAAEPHQQETTYEVRYYIQPNFEPISIPEDAILEENGQYVSWPDLTTKDLKRFSADLKLQAVAAEDDTDVSSENTEDQSGVYMDGEPVYLFAQSALQSAAKLPPITAKTAKLNSWDDRTYDINLSVTAQSQIISSTTPCDIILVLDRSGSMGDTFYTYTPITGSPDTDNTYYIALDGGYQEVEYREPWLSDNGWYYGSWPNRHQVYPQEGGTGSGNNYQFYTRSSQAKLDALQTAANQFVSNVTDNSSDSRIGVVSFASDASIDTKSNSMQLLRVGNGASETEIHRAIDNLTASGATAADYAMQKVKSLLDSTEKHEPVTTVSPRNKVIIFFTDGEPNHGNGFSNTVANAAIAAANTLKAAPYNATVYSIGVFSNLTGTNLTRVENYMKDLASFKANSTTEKQYYHAGDSTALNNIFESISTEVGGLSGTTVTDVIDPRFELTQNSRDDLVAAGATITDNADGTQTITWSNQTINVKKDASGHLIPDWTKTFTVKAKDQFIGGNNIPTNVKASSGVAYGDGQSEKFPQPTVNVKPEFYVGNAEDTIFYGEEVPTITLSKYKVSGQDLFCGQSATGSFSYQWLKADGITQIATAEAFPANNQFPVNDTFYSLKAVFTPVAATDASKINSNGKFAQTTANTVASGSAEGKYSIHVMKGQLNITKHVDNKYPASPKVNASQSFVFKIERRDTQSGSVADTFYEVISLSDALTGNKIISGLKKGYYTVTEQTGDAWRYTQTAINDNDSFEGSATDGMAYIGREIPAAGDVAKTYFGIAENPAGVGFTNSLISNQWLSDTTVAVNTIRHAS